MGKVVAVALILTWSLVPIAFLLVSSFKPSADIFAVPPRLTFAPTVKHFVDLWAQWRGFFTGLRNSAIVTAGATLLAVVRKHHGRICLLALSRPPKWPAPRISRCGAPFAADRDHPAVVSDGQLAADQ
jgi:ABC-type spermidine/putrescine transport system permease subunit II